MDDTAAHLKQKLSKQIDTARGKLEALKRDILNLHDEDVAALSQRQTEIRARLEQQKARAQKLQSDIARWKDERIAHTQEAIAGWMQARELDKLQARAEKAESYALDMVTVAAYDFEEAEQAVFEAVTARFEAESALAASRPR
jgi:TolA-binding protein